VGENRDQNARLRAQGGKKARGAHRLPLREQGKRCGVSPARGVQKRGGLSLNLTAQKRKKASIRFIRRGGPPPNS